MASPPARPRKLPPVWLLGMANAPLGVAGGLALLTLPQLLAARHVPETSIAGITSLGLLASTCAFLLGPLLDVWLSRRAYAALSTLVCAASAATALLNVGNLGVLTVAVASMMLFAQVNTNAIGGWFGSLEDKEADAGLGAWMVVANTAGFGLIAMAAIPVVRGASPGLAAAALVAHRAFLTERALYGLRSSRRSGDDLSGRRTRGRNDDALRPAPHGRSGVAGRARDSPSRP